MSDSTSPLTSHEEYLGKSTPTASSEPAAPTVREVLMPMAEIGGRRGPDPTRYGDWEKNGRCIDF